MSTQTDDAGGAEDPEPTVFTRIIRGEIPGRFVWRDPDVVAFLTIAPIRPGHVLVVPIEQIDHWVDVPIDLFHRITDVQHAIGRAMNRAFRPARVGSIIAGLEVPHCHVHLIPIDTESQLSFANAKPDTPAEELDATAELIRSTLREDGWGESVPDA